MSDGDPWSRLRRHTTARIALGRAGGSLPTEELLDFQLAHARARDAVHHPIDFEGLAQQITERTGRETLRLESAAADRATYLRRPDLGRRLSVPSRAALSGFDTAPAPEIAVVIGDGLSGLAVERNALPLLTALLPPLDARGWQLAPITLVRNARVAIQDEIGALLRARLSVILIGERPGLGVPDSLAAYFTWAPRPGRNDSERNCISNIRDAGLSPGAAAERLIGLLDAAFARQLSGVALKDESPLEALGAQGGAALGRET
ncbi:MAG: ethanolamine ammonia-lyase subunit EutC [Pseudomonadales bacterium]|jgi:ethanolamine ammonia-lyase small subunit|nr:ethanolamine ammonia-lyase subunit EutC [Pseudomonadales bacterium]